MAGLKKVEGKPTIDVMLVVIRTTDEAYAVDTASKLGVEPQVNTVDAIRLVKLGRLLAQKPEQTTLTGHTLTLTDNVFIMEVVQILQGGKITVDTDGNKTYTPPVAGSTEKGKVFELDAYSAIYDASGQIVKFEKTTYPNCQGSPITINSEDDVFRVSEYTIMSAPKTGDPAYTISYVDSLPEITEDGSGDTDQEAGGGQEVQTQSLEPQSAVMATPKRMNTSLTSGSLQKDEEEGEETGLSLGGETEVSRY